MARVDLEAMAMKEYSAFPKAPVLLEHHHQIVLCHNQDTRGGGLVPLQRCGCCILQPQLIGQPWIKKTSHLILDRKMTQKHYTQDLQKKKKKN